MFVTSKTALVALVAVALASQTMLVEGARTHSKRQATCKRSPARGQTKGGNVGQGIRNVINQIKNQGQQNNAAGQNKGNVAAVTGGSNAGVAGNNAGAAKAAADKAAADKAAADKAAADKAAAAGNNAATATGGGKTANNAAAGDANNNAGAAGGAAAAAGGAAAAAATPGVNAKNTKDFTKQGKEAADTAANSINNNDASTTLNPAVIQKITTNGLGVDTTLDNQAAAMVSTNNFINFCATAVQAGLPLTNGQQVKTGSCNPSPMGIMAANTVMPSSKFTNPQNLQDIAPLQTFTIKMTLNNLEAGVFTNAQTNYLSNPQTVNTKGQIIGHTHFTVEEMTSFQQTQVTDPTKFAFFKGINTPLDANSQLSIDVPGGLKAGFYRLCSINAAHTHQPVLVSVAQHGSLDDCIYFSTGKGNNAAGAAAAGNAAGGNNQAAAAGGNNQAANAAGGNNQAAAAKAAADKAAADKAAADKAAAAGGNNQAANAAAGGNNQAAAAKAAADKAAADKAAAAGGNNQAANAAGGNNQAAAAKAAADKAAADKAAADQKAQQKQKRQVIDSIYYKPTFQYNN